MAVKNTTQVLIDGKIITLGGYESPEHGCLFWYLELP